MPLAPERSVLGDIADVVALNATDEKELVGKVEDAAALMVYHSIFRLSGATIDRLSGCKVITRCGVGSDNVELAAAQRRDSPVCNVPDYGRKEEVADSGNVRMILTLAAASTCSTHGCVTAGKNGITRTRPRSSGSAAGHWASSAWHKMRSTVAVRGKAVGMRVLYSDPYTPDGYDKALGVTRAETLDELLVQSDVMTCHCPLTDETRHMVNAAAIAKLKRGSYLVNNARGAVVDAAAIPDAIAWVNSPARASTCWRRDPHRPDHPLITT